MEGIHEVMSAPSPEIAIVFPSGSLKISDEEKKKTLNTLRGMNLSFRLFETEAESEDGSSAGFTQERAMLLSQAITLRKHPILWAGKGGYGSTTLLPFLDLLLPPVIPDTTLLGYSDVSFLGNVLSARYPNFTYIMAGHAFEPNLLNLEFEHTQLTHSLLRGENPGPREYELIAARNDRGSWIKMPEQIDGLVFPINLSMAESYVALQKIRSSRGLVLFLEDVSEDLYRLLRKLDSLKNSGFLEHTEAIVLGSFEGCVDEHDQAIDLERFSNLVQKRTHIPTFLMPKFGHGEMNLPLVQGSRVELTKTQDKMSWRMQLYFERHKARSVSTAYQPSGFLQNGLQRVHFIGIGGTGMSGVAGIAKESGLEVTGSDGPLYPPVSEILEAIGIKPNSEYKPENIPLDVDCVVLANAISRVGGQLQKNPEFEALIRTYTATVSFPTFLRETFLYKSFNIVVTGTHGKTTTTSAISFALDELHRNPSFLIGGTPKNFDRGFRLGSRELFVVEGDEYDTALFDKGPKFLHYHPKVTIVGNIEFDHADIYADLEAIRQEFSNLVMLTTANKGIVVANLDDPNVRSILRPQTPVVGFTTQSKDHLDSPYPCWRLKSCEMTEKGNKLVLESPNNQEVQLTAGIFGEHNARNLLASVCALHAYHLLEEKHEGYSPEQLRTAAEALSSSAAERWCEAFEGFQGVRRRFERIASIGDITVFDDFAHHPTAVSGSIQAFHAYHTLLQRNGELRICFDPRNATMRRNVLESELSEALKQAGHVYIGQVAQDRRIPENERLSGKRVAQKVGSHCRAYESNDDLLRDLRSEVQRGDTVVFMSSGSFNNLPRRLAEELLLNAGEVQNNA